MTIDAIRLFGSAMRAETDEFSDTDILIVGNSESLEKKVEEKILDTNYQNISYSFYGKKRILDMFSQGHLFAWHLFYKSKPLFTKSDFIADLGKPSAYLNAKKDILEFENLIRQIPESINKNIYNSIYECGILYICSRNISLCGSMTILKNPDFSRNSPYNLSRELNLDFPLSLEDYQNCLLCRKNGMIGKEHFPIKDTKKKVHAVLKWVEKVKGLI